MARLPRLILAGQAHHVILRGNNRQAIFVDDDDRRRMLQVLLEVSRLYGVALHAFVLMDNHLHMLVTPGEAEALSRMMQALGRRYVGAFNARHHRTGTLWEGRFRAGLVEGERHLLACLRYIELNPVRAGLVADPADWPWSSAGHHLGRARQSLITEHPLYWALGNTPFEREHGYRELMQQGLTSAEHQRLTEAVLRGRPVVSEALQASLQQEHARVAVARPRGRPRKVPEPGIE